MVATSTGYWYGFKLVHAKILLILFLSWTTSLNLLSVTCRFPAKVPGTIHTDFSRKLRLFELCSAPSNPVTLVSGTGLYAQTNACSLLPKARPTYSSSKYRNIPESLSSKFGVQCWRYRSWFCLILDSKFLVFLSRDGELSI
ncbi:hypothetical protein EDD22DRAFT_857592 [Suillus occidentalis]|nr:hypothetical protein EDD22DRAFT_857592 [Suillus occidentalis]